MSPWLVDSVLLAICSSPSLGGAHRAWHDQERPWTIALAAEMGGYTHRVLIPQTEPSPSDGSAPQRFRRVATFETVVLCAVTAFLVGAAS